MSHLQDVTSPLSSFPCSIFCGWCCQISWWGDNPRDVKFSPHAPCVGWGLGRGLDPPQNRQKKDSRGGKGC